MTSTTERCGCECHDKFTQKSHGDCCFILKPCTPPSTPIEKELDMTTTRTCTTGHTMTGIGFDDGCPECEAPWSTPPVRGNWEEEFDRRWHEFPYAEMGKISDELKNFIRQTLKQTLEDIKGEVERSKINTEAVDGPYFRGANHGIERAAAILADKIEKI